jgi:cyclophilin family peptidyl-prolyl cis-trans isomerase/protein-disulfide isomerase
LRLIMKKRLFFLSLLAVLLAACASSTPTPTVTVIAATASVLPEPVLPTASPESFSGRPPGTELSVDIDGPPRAGCTLQTVIRSADAEEASLFPDVNETDWVTGPDDAATTIIEYADFECPFCGLLEPTLAQLRADYPEDVRVVFRHLPLLTIHNKAGLAMIAAEAAGRQGRFWDMHGLLFARQPEWTPLTPEDFEVWLSDRAVELGLDLAQFTADLHDPAMSDAVQAAYDEAIESGIPGAPFLLINGRIYSGPTDYDNLSVIVRLYSLQERVYDSCPTMIIDPAREYYATLVTDKGNIFIELDPEAAPLAVNNFVYLALDGFYDGVTFHRVFPGYIAQAGDPSGTGFGGSGYAFEREETGLQFDAPGVLAMDSEANGSQFFITYAPLDSLDGSYTIFGRVLEGLDVLEALTSRDPSDGVNQPPGDEIITILIEEN